MALPIDTTRAALCCVSVVRTACEWCLALGRARPHDHTACCTQYFSLRHLYRWLNIARWTPTTAVRVTSILNPADNFPRFPTPTPASTCFYSSSPTTCHRECTRARHRELVSWCATMLRSRSLAVALAGLLAQGACGLYADEAGKLDWHRQNLGRFVSASFDGRGGLTVVGEVRVKRRSGGLGHGDWGLPARTPRARRTGRGVIGALRV